MIYRDVSVHRADGSLYDVTSCMAVRSHVPPRRVSVSGPMLFLDGSLSGGAFVQRVSVRGVSVQGDVYLIIKKSVFGVTAGVVSCGRWCGVVRCGVMCGRVVSCVVWEWCGVE